MGEMADMMFENGLEDYEDQYEDWVYSSYKFNAEALFTKVNKIEKVVEKRKKVMSEVMTPKFRASFPALFKPESYLDGPAKYSVQMMFNADEDLSKIEALIMEAGIAKFGKEKYDKLSITPKWKHPLRNGDEKTNKEGDAVEMYAGKIYATASTKYQPPLVDEKKEEIISESEFYPGCYARAVVNAYAYDVKGNVGVALGLQAIQRLAKGERIGGGRVDAQKVFDEVETSEESTENEF